MTRYCFVLILPPEVEEKLLDELLAHFATDVFTSTPTFTHSPTTVGMRSDEQVLGRRRAVQVQIVLDRLDAVRLREMLGRKFADVGLHYWITPVLAEGELV